jgi:phospholipid/cholesterol/gamma-HCH transport system substrate-binding protein
MATASPPRPPASTPPPGADPSQPGGRPRAQPPRQTGRILAFSALGVVVLIVLYLLFAGGGGGTYQLVFGEAGQLVRGDQVQVGGVPVGSVTNIVLTHNYKARVTIHVDSSLTPLHLGTVAQVRVPSLATVANRYIALTPGPNNAPALAPGSTLPASATKEVVDLDELFNTLNPKTRRGLQQVIQGFAEQYAGASKAFGVSAEYTPAALAATTHFLSELDRDQPVFTSFLVETAKAVTTIGARSEDLTDLIGNANTTFQAIGSRQEQLARGLKLLPVTLRQGNRTFAQLPSTLHALENLVEASRPTTKPLEKFFPSLRSLIIPATPVVTNFSTAFSKPGASNDLTDWANALPALAKALTTASPSTVTALKESVPITAVFGPYTPDLEGTLRTFGQASSYYDANGHYVHINPVFPDFTPDSEGNLTPAANAGQAVKEGLKAGQLRRCPGAATQPAADGSSPFTAGEALSCDPSETP